MSLLPFITTYSPTAVKLVKVIKNNFQNVIVQNNHLQEFRIIAAFRKNKNLQDTLVKAKLQPLMIPRPSGLGCFFQTQSWAWNQHIKNIFPTQRRTSVKSKNGVFDLVQELWFTICGRNR